MAVCPSVRIISLEKRYEFQYTVFVNVFLICENSFIFVSVIQDNLNIVSKFGYGFAPLLHFACQCIRRRKRQLTSLDLTFAAQIILCQLSRVVNYDRVSVDTKLAMSDSWETIFRVRFCPGVLSQIQSWD